MKAKLERIDQCPSALPGTGHLWSNQRSDGSRECLFCRGQSKPEPKNKPCAFSACMKYRYTLWREWGFSGLYSSQAALGRSDEYLMVIGLNPSTADDTQDDPTIRRCIDFAKRWGFGGLCMTNLFAWRDTKPENMKAAASPIQPAGTRDNDKWLQHCADNAGMILAAWGTHGRYLDRSLDVVHKLPLMKCLVKNADGSPKHPLYVPASTTPIDL